jgi:protein phosphatase
MEGNGQFVSAAISDRGLNEKRPQNEDSFIEMKQLGVFAVADGVGGAQAGDVASQMAVEILGEAFVNYVDTVDPEDIMRMAIERANSAIYQMANDLPQLASMATTIVALHTSGNVATIAHVGDSRLYSVDVYGNLHRQTNDHSVVEEEVRAGRMTPEQAANHPSRNVISRAVGAEPTVDVDIKTIMVDPGTTFLLCSDGITRHIEDNEVAQLLTSGMNPDTMCQKLKEICFDRGAEDNLTAIVVKVAGHPEDVSTEVPPTQRLVEPVADVEEVDTVATARSPFDAPAEEFTEAPVQNLTDTIPVISESPMTDTIPVIAEQPTEPVDRIEEVAPEPEVQQVAPVETSTYVVKDEAPPAVIAPRGVEQTADPSFTMFGADSRVHVIPARPTTSVAGKILSSIVWLVLGGVIGALGYYYSYQTNPQPSPQPTPISEMKSNNQPLTAFEEGRRLVDSDPAKYLTANAASPQIPEDYFLLGRAFMQTGKYWEARRAFNEAKARMANADRQNVKTLDAEIAMAIAVLDSAPATESFKRAIEGQTTQNSNTNSAGNTAAANR